MWKKFMSLPLWLRTLIWDIAVWLVLLPGFLASSPDKPNTGGIDGAAIGFSSICFFGLWGYLLRVLYEEQKKKRRNRIQSQASALGLVQTPAKLLRPHEFEELFTANTRASVTATLGAPISQWCFIVNDSGAVGLAIAESTSHICLFHASKSHPAPDMRIINAVDVLDWSIEENWQTLTTQSLQTATSTSSLVGRAVAGGLIAGPAGAVVGGATAKKRTTGTTVYHEMVNSIALRLLINDIRAPNFTINFLPHPVERNSDAYERATQQAAHWHGVIAVMKLRTTT
jgi:hypothetical protein